MFSYGGTDKYIYEYTIYSVYLVRIKKLGIHVFQNFPNALAREFGF